MSYRPFLIALSLLFFATPALAIGDETPSWCDIPLPIRLAGDSCGSSEYLSVSPIGIAADCGIECVPAHEPPKDLSLSCTPSGASRYQCEVWPQGVAGEFSYDWFVTGSLSIDGEALPDSPQQTIDCVTNPIDRSHFVSVVVTSPYGLSTTTFMPLNCN